MRGRTNIVQRLGAVVNGDLITAEVSGEDISVGDFVSYKTVDDYEKILDTGLYLRNYEDLGEDYYAFIQGTSLYLAKYENSKLKIVYVYNDYSILSFCLLKDGSIACTISVSPYVIRIKREGDKFILLNLSSTGSENTSTYRSAGKYCFVYENVICVIYSPNSTKVKGAISFFNIDENFEISYVKYIDTLDGKIIFDSIVVDGNKFYYLSNSSSPLFLDKIEVDVANYTISRDNLYFNESVPGYIYTSNFYFGKSLLLYNKYYVFFYSDNKNHRFAIVNLNTNSYNYELISKTGININDVSSTTPSYYFSCFSKIINDNKFLIFINKQAAILEFKQETAEIILFSNIILRYITQKINLILIKFH